MSRTDHVSVAAMETNINQMRLKVENYIKTIAAK
jgi:hypothetical protein